MHLLGAIGAIILRIIMMPGFLGWWESGHTATQQRIVANHMTAVTRAARQYVNRHQDTLLTQASASAGPSVTIADLINEGFLT